MAEGQEANNEAVAHHLKRSFTEGDTNYLAQFFYAVNQFLFGDMGVAERAFKALRSRKLSPSIRDQPREVIREASGDPRQFAGRVRSTFDTYCFARIDELRTDVFVHHAQFQTEIWDSIEVGSRILCNVAFTMRGAAGINAVLAE